MKNAIDNIIVVVSFLSYCAQVLSITIYRTHICCGRTVHYRGFRNLCCGTVPYNSFTQICCGETVHVAGESAHCCGSLPYNYCTHICCKGILRYKGFSNSCCGSVPYNSFAAVELYSSLAADYNGFMNCIL